MNVAINLLFVLVCGYFINECMLQKKLKYFYIMNSLYKQTHFKMPFSTSNANGKTGGDNKGNGQNHTKSVVVLQSIIFSICIPRVFKNINEKRIREILYSLNLGFIERVDMVAKTGTNGGEFWCVFVHFSKWNVSPDADAVREKLENGDKVKIVYDNPWFWLVSLYKPTHRDSTDISRHKAYIDFTYTSSPTQVIPVSVTCPEADARLFDADIEWEHNEFVMENEIQYQESQLSLPVKPKAVIHPDVYRINPDGCVSSFILGNGSSASLSDCHIHAPKWPPLGFGRWYTPHNSQTNRSSGKQWY